MHLSSCSSSLHTHTHTHTHRSRPHLLTILSHGWQTEELTQQLNSLVTKHKDSVLLLETTCPSSAVSANQLPWKRCSSATAKVYSYPGVLQVTIILLNVFYIDCKILFHTRSQDTAFYCQVCDMAILISQT